MALRLIIARSSSSSYSLLPAGMAPRSMVRRRFSSGTKQPPVEDAVQDVIKELTKRNKELTSRNEELTSRNEELLKEINDIKDRPTISSWTKHPAEDALDLEIKYLTKSNKELLEEINDAKNDGPVTVGEAVTFVGQCAAIAFGYKYYFKHGRREENQQQH